MKKEETIVREGRAYRAYGLIIGLIGLMGLMGCSKDEASVKEAFFALLKKPILFYTYDRDTYQLLRGVHQDVLETAPGKVCDTFSGLIEALNNEDFDLEKTKKFADEYSIVLEEDSAAKIIDEVFGKGQESE